MLKLFAAAAACAGLVLGAAQGAQAADLNGAGATFPAPVYAKWAETYKQQTQTGLNYQAIGSGGGIKQIKAKTVDFGASDKPLKPEDLNAAGLMQFPTVVGGVVPVMNIPGICWPRSISATSRSGTTRRSPPIIMASTCPTCRSPSCTARTARAPASCSPAIWR
jgi:ABC-type phosphate transport system substrate-binding protein